jgi:hypothetical protein
VRNYFHVAKTVCGQKIHTVAYYYVQYSLENSTMSITKKRDVKTAVVDTGPYILSTLAAHGLEDGE